MTLNKNEITVIDSLGSYLENVDKNIELIDDFCFKRRIHFLCELKNKVTLEEYKAFLSSLEMFKMIDGAKMQ
jgi:hypothetical protein